MSDNQMPVVRLDYDDTDLPAVFLEELKVLVEKYGLCAEAVESCCIDHPEVAHIVEISTVGSYSLNLEFLK